MPAASVIIPAYNQGRFLGAAIQSVLDQTFTSVEAIVVDDGSTDDTADVVERFQDARVRYVYQENRGLSAARNTGVRNARGHFLSYLDSDDLFLPQKLERLLAAMEAEPGAGLAAGQAIPVDEHGRPVGRAFDSGPPSEVQRLLLGNPLHVGSVLVRREWQERVGFFDTTLRSYEDWDMWLRLALADCRMLWVDEPVSLYRFHSEQMTRDQRQMTQASFAVLDKVFGREDLPDDWRALEDQAYSRGHLRGAAQAFRSEDWEGAQDHLVKAVARDPELAADNYEALAQQFAAWCDLPKIDDTAEFLESVYDHLPPAFEGLRRRRSSDLGEHAIQKAFEAYAHGDASAARQACLRAFRYRPQWLTNRGVLSIFVRSSLGSARHVAQA